MANSASLHSPAECSRCGRVLLRPAWSESVAPQRVVNIWHCQVCDHEFETSEQCVGQTISDAELLRTFFPNLLVA